MADAIRPGRVARVAAGGLSGGLLLMIWSGVWYAAVVAGKSAPAEWKPLACLAGFVVGLALAVGGFAYLRSRRLSLADGSVTHETPALPSDPATARAVRRGERAV